jgi:hypothetical protein
MSAGVRSSSAAVDLGGDRAVKTIPLDPAGAGADRYGNAGRRLLQHEPDGRIDFGATPFRRFDHKSPDQNVNGVLSGRMWIDTELTYSFPNSKRDYGPNYPVDEKGTPKVNGPVGTFKKFTEEQITAAEYWLDQYSNVSQLSFVELDGRSGAQDEDQEAPCASPTARTPIRPMLSTQAAGRVPETCGSTHPSTCRGWAISPGVR